MPFDRLLEKRRVYVQMSGPPPGGNLGELPECSALNPFTYGNCINVFRNARLDIQQIYTRIIEMSNSYDVALSELAGRTDARSVALAAYTQQRASEVRNLLTEAVAVANALEVEIDNYRWIPGFDTVFLNGLGGASLGTLPLVPAAGVPMAIFYTVAGLVMAGSLAYIVGQIASTLRADTDLQIAKHNAWGGCMKAYQEAIARGQEPPACGGQPFEISATTLLIGAAAVVGVVLITSGGRRRR